MTLAAFCLAWPGHAPADNVSNHADPSKHHHYANPDGKLAFSDPNNVMPGHYNYRFYVDQVARDPGPVVWESPSSGGLEILPVSQVVAVAETREVVVPSPSAQWNPANPGAIPPSTPVQTPTSVNKASKLIGMKVKNQNNQTLGKIKDVIIDPQSGRVDYVVMKKAGRTHGTGKEIAVPLTAFTPSPDRSHLVLNADKSQVQNARGFSKNNLPAMDNPVYGAQPAGAQPAADTQPRIYIVPVPVTPEQDQKQDKDSDHDQTSPSHTIPNTGTDY
ncbi:MAG: photosystem reaction center subunit [Pedosphaera sp.]|nr:photosystem reaction center subunit [Pedosphaera sp.]